MRRAGSAIFLSTWLALSIGCTHRSASRAVAVIAIESSPNNLDLRQGTDAQSERIGALVFDSLVRKDEHYNLQPWLAEHWEQPDPLTWIFHLRPDVHFHDGRPLEAADVAWTIHSMVDGTLLTAKGSAFAAVDHLVTPDPLTLIIHLKHPDAGLLFNLSDGLFGVVPRGSGAELGLRPIGSGPFAFVSAMQDKEVQLTRNDRYWAGPPSIAGLRFAVIPDAITTALELRRGSVDAESNVITLDMVHTLEGTPALETSSSDGSIVIYLNFNVTDSLLRDRRVRQAIACAMDRPAIIRALWRGQAREASSLLPSGHWARAADSELPAYQHNVRRAQRLLDAAGYRADNNGVRLRLSLKTSTDETTRMLAAVLQQQLRAAGIALTIRSAEFGTFYADVTRGAFQMYALRWIGSNEDPDIFRYAYGSASMPPHGGNRGRYSNAELDRLLNEAAATSNLLQRRNMYVRVQQILAEDLPTIPLWYPRNEVVHTTRLQGVEPNASGDFSWLRTARLNAQ